MGLAFASADSVLFISTVDQLADISVRTLSRAVNEWLGGRGVQSRERPIRVLEGSVTAVWACIDPGCAETRMTCSYSPIRVVEALGCVYSPIWL
jgi:hypothetical protein